MARTSYSNADTNNASRVALRAKAANQKKAKKMIQKGHSYTEMVNETTLKKPTLQYHRKQQLKHNKDFFPPALRLEIQCSVVNYVHRELLRRPRVYIRRPSPSQPSNPKVVGLKEVTEYLKRHWKTAHENGQLPLQSEKWIPKKKVYYKILQFIPSPSQLRIRMQKLKPKRNLDLE